MIVGRASRYEGAGGGAFLHRRRDRVRASLVVGTLLATTCVVGALAARTGVATGPGSPSAPSAAAFRSTGVVHDVYQGDSIAAAVDASDDGDSIVVHAGSYPSVTLTRQFPTAVRITGAPGETVTVGGFVISGGSGYLIDNLRTNGESRLESDAHDVVFDNVRCAIPAGDQSGSCFYFRDSSHRAVLSNSSASGGWDGVKFYGCTGRTWATDILVLDSTIAGAYEDNVHVDCARNVTIEHNFIHDPLDNLNHNDGIQTQASDNLRIVRNTFSFASVRPVGGPNQAMMLGNVPASWPDRKVTDTLVANNLVTHWNGGRPLIMNGTENTLIVNNTFVDSGNAAKNDPSITVANQGSAGGQNPGLEIWNNIMRSALFATGSAPPAFFSTNLIANPYRGMSGANVIRGNPRFVDRTSYALAPNSPALGRGLIRPGTPADDIDGRPRAVRLTRTTRVHTLSSRSGVSLGAR
jgi:hypothetical protein